MAIYRFTDTIERAFRGGYPAEALNFNGSYFEDEIEGYQTLAVTGRESLEAEINTIETSAMHGARFRSSRYLPRVITVRYKLRAKSASELIEKYNRLNYLLGTEEAKLIFRDEPDKFWTGTRRNLTPPEAGMLTTTGEIEFLCTDPFKYSVEEYEVKAVNNSISARYNGTQQSPPVFRVRAQGDISFIEFLKDTARIGIGLSYDITQGESGESRTLLDKSGGDDPVMALVTWTQPDIDITLRPCTEDPVGILAAEMAIDMPGGGMRFGHDVVLIGGEYWASRYQGDANKILVLSSDDRSLIQLDGWVSNIGPQELRDDLYSSSMYKLFGSATQYSLADIVSRPNFSVEWESRFYSDNMMSRGAQAFTIYAEKTVADEEDSETIETIPVFGIVIQKSAVGTNRLEISVWLNNVRVDRIVMRSDALNEAFGKKSLKCSISRFGYVYTLRIGNDVYSYQSDGAPTPSCLTTYILDYVGSPAMTVNALRYLRYVEHTASSENGIKNIIKSGDEVIINCGSAAINVNGVQELGLGDITNQWDEMSLVPGDNNIGINMISDSSAKAPEITMVYREAFI